MLDSDVFVLYNKWKFDSWIIPYLKMLSYLSIILLINLFDFHQLIFQHSKLREWNMSYLMLIAVFWSSILYDNCWQLSFNTEDAETTISAVADREV